MPNRLAHASSPYLLQHAHNPVDWWPWGQEAIAEARRRDVPIFLSVGYSTCYWCHVMERESFEHADTARLLNGGFVPVKLDREERPDIDAVYMAATQLLTGQGGWPMSVFLEPGQLRPFFAGTYFPLEPAFGRPSFRQVLSGMSDAYARRRADVLAQSATVSAAVTEHLAAAQSPVPLSVEHVQRTAQTLLTTADHAHGGFGGAPKFPQPLYLDFLLDLLPRAADADTAAAIERTLRHTLEAMALGGIHDHLGGGFHRYSVDRFWLVPHFEKMLYDQALLLRVYARAAALWDDAWLARVCARLVGFLDRELTLPDGALATALDAEVGGREGLNYLWDAQSARDALGAALAPAQTARALEFLGLSAGPNFQDPHHPSDPPRNVLRLAARPSPADEALLDAASEALLRARAQRPAPRLDDKAIASWNAMAICALTDAATLLKAPAWLDRAQRAADAAVARLCKPDGSVLRSERLGVPGPMGTLEDAAAMAAALLALHRAGRGGGAYLARAEAILDRAAALFADDAGGFYDTPDGAGPDAPFVRPRSTYDGATPSGVSLALHALLDAFEITGRVGRLDAARRALLRVSPAVHESPASACNSARALLRVLALDPAGWDNACAALDPAARPRPTTSAAVVRVLTSADELVVSPREPGRLLLRLEIDEGYHINSAFAGQQSGGVVVPLRLDLADAQGLRLYADYPAGESHGTFTHTVHHGVVQFQAVIEQTGPIQGRPRVVLTYQACTDAACLAPAHDTLGLTITPDDGA
ncbi:MAG: N-acylglucosamine 2-epimerase [Isosphaera sp.]|nr:N-acylglucosamine 2-epimerase [Isosphaera sp.]